MTTLFFESDACSYLGVSHRAEQDYLAGCRCPAAREDHRINRGRRQLRALRTGPANIDPTGTRRRLQALAAIGYSVEDIAAGLASRPSYIGQLQHRTGRVHRRTAAAVLGFYTAHADRPGPSPRAVHYANRNGWLAPIWWDDDTINDPAYSPPTARHLRWRQDVLDVDEVKVDRRLGGDATVQLSRAEKAVAVRRLAGSGVPLSDISVRLGINGVYVRKYAAGGAA